MIKKILFTLYKMIMKYLKMTEENSIITYKMEIELMLIVIEKFKACYSLW